MASLFAEFFRDLDIVPSDIIAGLVLLRQRQRSNRGAILDQVTGDGDQYGERERGMGGLGKMLTELEGLFVFDIVLLVLYIPMCEIVLFFSLRPTMTF